MTNPPGSDAPASDEPLPPAWKRPTHGEQRWISALAILVVAGAQFALPDRVQAKPRYVVPAVEVLLLAALFFMEPGRIERRDPVLRRISLGLTAVLFASDAWSGAALVTDLLRGHPSFTPLHVLRYGAIIYAINVIVFAFWYWELDRGGPVDRAQGLRAYPDFLFPQMQAGDLVSPEWEPNFLDYLYVSFTNVTAFSPTDTMPLTRWAKLLMMLQSALSLLLVVLVFARAVNILK